MSTNSKMSTTATTTTNTSARKLASGAKGANLAMLEAATGTEAPAIVAPTVAVATMADFAYPATGNTRKGAWRPIAGTVPGNIALALNNGPISQAHALALIAPVVDGVGAKVGKQHKLVALCKYMAANMGYGTQLVGGTLSKL